MPDLPSPANASTFLLSAFLTSPNESLTLFLRSIDFHSIFSRVLFPLTGAIKISATKPSVAPVKTSTATFTAALIWVRI